MSYFIFVNIHLNLHGILQSISLKENLSGIFQGLFQDTCERVTDRKARGPQEAGGNKLQVADISFLFFLLHTKLKEVSRQHLVLSWANQCIFLMEMFFLSYVNETMCLLWNLPFFKKIPSETFFPPSNLGLIMAQQTSIHVNCSMAREDTPQVILSQKCILWERGLVKLPQPWGVSLVWLIAC